MDRRRSSRGGATSPARGRSIKKEDSAAAPALKSPSRSKERLASPVKERSATPVNLENRRPLTSRDTSAAKWAASKLAKLGVSPNTISVASIFCAFGAAACFYYAGKEKEVVCQALWFFGAMVGIQLRLLCNMLDGMVAVENNMRSKTGELFNEIPDRISDVAILMGAAYSVSSGRCPNYNRCAAEYLAVAASLGAMFTAYVRAMGVVAGAKQAFHGPMAKPHRMALLTGACAVAAAQYWYNGGCETIPYALAIITAGTVITSFRRLAAIASELNSKP